MYPADAGALFLCNIYKKLKFGHNIAKNTLKNFAAKKVKFVAKKEINHLHWRAARLSLFSAQLDRIWNLLDG